MGDNNNKDCPNVGNIINSWYSIMNIPLSANFGNVIENMKKYGPKAPSKWSIIWFINKFYKIIEGAGTSISAEGKSKFYDMYNVLKLFNPVFFIIFTFLVMSDCEPIYKISDSTVMQNIPTSITYMYIVLFVIVIGIVIYNLYKKISCFQDIKTNGFKSFYIVVLLIGVGMILLINFLLPTIISPIMDSITTLTSDEQSTYTKLVVYGVFFILAIIFVILFAKIYRGKRLGKFKSDSSYFSVLGGIASNIYLIISLLLATGIITYIFSGLGSFLLTLMLGCIYFVYIIIIYLMLYTILEGGDYKKILVFTVLLLIIITLAGLYLLYETVESINSLCTESSGSSSSTGMGTILANAFLPILLFFMTIYLYGMVYNENNWDQTKSKFYIFYTIYSLIIIMSWFTSNISVGFIYTIMWIVITVIQRKWIGHLFKAIRSDAKAVGNSVKKGVKTIEGNVQALAHKK